MLLNNSECTFYTYLKDLRLGSPLDDRVVFFAPRCIAERPNIEPWKPSVTGRMPSALLASSTTYGQDPKFYTSCLAALSHAGWETVVAIGNHNSAFDFDPLPKGCRLAINVPLMSVMPHVDIVICAAGMATAMEALYHGRPMLMLTRGQAELEAYGQQFHNHGLGMHLPGVGINAEQVVQCATAMINDLELRRNIVRNQQSVRTGAGAEELVNWLEKD
jgi:demethyllactenocin mycarosyltransferase